MAITIETRPTVGGIAHTGSLIDELLMYWKCDEGSGLIITDSHNGIVGTLSNASFSAS